MQIERTGKVHFHDASLAVWEDGISAARDSGGYEGERVWESQFKRDVFARIVQQLNRLGWAVMKQKHIITNNNSRYCRKGNLRADLSISGRHIELKMFQNVNAPERPDHGGRYQFDKEQHMPYPLRLEMERTRRRIRDYLCNVFAGYVFDEGKPEHKDVRPGGITALQWIEARYRDSWHFKGDLSTYKIEAYNSESADGGTITHGARVWGFDETKGRPFAGTAYYNINSMWWVITGKYSWRNVHSRGLHLTQPENLRTKRNGVIRRSRLEKELSKAIAAMNFRRAEVLRNILFPENQPLYLLYHTGHQAYHGPCFRGYTDNIVRAGKFTLDEVKGWADDRNKVIPMVAA